MTALRFAGAATAALSLSLSALSQSLTPYWPETETRRWADRSMYPGQYGAITKARISDFGYPDVVFLAGDQPMVMIAPALFHAIVPLPGTSGYAANDVIGLDGPGHTYALAMVGPTGLGLWNGPDPVSLKVIQHPSWLGATRVREVLGADYLVGTNPVLEQAVFANSSLGTHLHSWSVPELLCATPFDYDGDGVDEIGLVTKSGVEIRDLGNGFITRFPADIRSSSAERLRLANTPAKLEALSMLSNIAGLDVLGTVSSIHQEATVLETSGAHDLVVVDANADGLDEILMPSGTRAALDLMWPLYGTHAAWFQYVSYGGLDIRLPAGTNVTETPGLPLILDLDGDDRQDLVHLVQGEDTILTPRNPLATGVAPLVKYVGLYAVRYGILARLYIDANHDDVPEGANNVEMLLYDWNGGAPILQPMWGASHSFAGGQPATTHESGWFLESAIDEGVIQMIVRYTRVEQGKRVRAWPPIQLLVTNNSELYVDIQSVDSSTPTLGDIGGLTTGGVNDIKHSPPPLPLFTTGG